VPKLLIFLLLTAGYLGFLTFSLMRWRGFQVTVRNNARPLFILSLLFVLFVGLVGLEGIVAVVIFPFFFAVLLGIMTGPVGAIVGFLIGIGLSICYLFYEVVY
jgi:hypothetical protein